MRRFLGYSIVILFGILVFLSLTAVLTGLFSGDYMSVLIGGAGLLVLFVMKESVIKFIRKNITRL